MMHCEICGKNKVYLCSDNRNAWCRNGCGSYAYAEEVLLYLGRDLSRYAVKYDGTIRKIKRKQEGNTTIIEEERLIEVENKLKELIGKKRNLNERGYNASNWWYRLKKEEKIEVYENSSINKPLIEKKESIPIIIPTKYPKLNCQEKCAFPEKQNCNGTDDGKEPRCQYMKYNNSKSISYPTRWECTYNKE